MPDTVSSGRRPALVAQVPQEQALVCQTMPTDAYGDELWTLNFPACLLPHRVRRIWFTRAEPFGSDARAPAGALAALFADAPTSVTVACDALRRRLGLTEDAVEIGLPPAPLRDAASLSIARNGGGLLLVPGALSSDATHGARKRRGAASFAKRGHVDERSHRFQRGLASQRDALAAASAVFIREDAIARLFDHALLAVRMGTRADPVLLARETINPFVWRRRRRAGHPFVAACAVRRDRARPVAMARRGNRCGVRAVGHGEAGDPHEESPS